MPRVKYVASPKMQKKRAAAFAAKNRRKARARKGKGLFG